MTWEWRNRYVQVEIPAGTDPRILALYIQEFGLTRPAPSLDDESDRSGSSTGRAPLSKSGDLGSNPSPTARKEPS